MSSYIVSNFFQSYHYRFIHLLEFHQSVYAFDPSGSTNVDKFFSAAFHLVIFCKYLSREVVVVWRNYFKNQQLLLRGPSFSSPAVFRNYLRCRDLVDEMRSEHKWIRAAAPCHISCIVISLAPAIFHVQPKLSDLCYDGVGNSFA